MPATMTPRERVIRAIEFNGPDRAPVHRAIFPGAFYRHGQKLVDLLNRWPDDFSPAPTTMPEPPKQEGDIEEYRDEWGCLWRRLKGYTTGEVIEPPIPTWDRYPGYKFPEPPDPEKHRANLEQSIAANEHRYYAFGSAANLFERLQFLRGTENLFVDLAEDRQELHELADRMVDFWLAGIKPSIAAGADGFYFSDDWGTQRALLISPQTWRRFFKPRYRRMFEPIKDAGRHVWFHTDGWTLEILEDFIELGVDVINPQHQCMGNERVAQIIAGRICLRTDLDRQWIIPFGTREQIEEHVKECMRLFGSNNGGIILHGEVGQDVPFDNIVALYEAFEKYGTYPLAWLRG
jgi:uroporphyrinogen decarboxylase